LFCRYRKQQTGSADFKAPEKLGFARFSSIEVLLFAIRHLIFTLVVLFFTIIWLNPVPVGPLSLLKKE
jgi:hypothetical protein